MLSVIESENKYKIEIYKDLHSPLLAESSMFLNCKGLTLVYNVL